MCLISYKCVSKSVLSQIIFFKRKGMSVLLAYSMLLTNGTQQKSNWVSNHRRIKSLKEAKYSPDLSLTQCTELFYNIFWQPGSYYMVTWFFLFFSFLTEQIFNHFLYRICFLVICSQFNIPYQMNSMKSWYYQPFLG